MWRHFFFYKFLSRRQTNDTAEGEEIQNVDEARPGDKRPLQEDYTTEAQPDKVARFELDDSADEFNWEYTITSTVV